MRKKTVTIDELLDTGRGEIRKEVINVKVKKKVTGRPITRTDKHRKRTINFSEDLWNELEVIAFINDGRDGSVTKELHKAAMMYIKSVKIPEEHEVIKKLILDRLK